MDLPSFSQSYSEVLNLWIEMLINILNRSGCNGHSFLFIINLIIIKYQSIINLIIIKNIFIDYWYKN
jgi:hypothetical protein